MAKNWQNVIYTTIKTNHFMQIFSCFTTKHIQIILIECKKKNIPPFVELQNYLFRLER